MRLRLPLSVAALAQLARVLALAALAAACAWPGEAQAQPVFGHGGRYNATVTPGVTHVYTVRYRRGEVARVTVNSSEESGLELLVSDSADTRVECIGKREDETGAIVCTWIPEATEDFRIRIRNSSGAYVGYLVYTN
ncbi:MAG: hypothetical protein LBQ12_15255 [Deltaproteobacteria bacterium]|jgi:hypothetical protein|nr:hypothetical protein [Deltaproteobacteria bacterium]